MTKELTQQFQQILEQTFKLNQFRPGQLEALTLLMTQGRLLCIQPTGYGKSLLYQLPAMLLEGMTLVISPLLALIRDQLIQLKNRFQIPSGSINSDQSEEENYRTRQAAVAGQIRILFVSPEQLDNIERLEFILRLPVSFLVVDEAHCISTWGHDFRPSYRQIIKLTHDLIKKNSQLKILGLTATANHQTELDIKKQLTVNGEKVWVHRESMTRGNLQLSVIPANGIADKLISVLEIVKQMSGVGLIYCATRENTEIVAEFLRKEEINSTAYHAGIESHQKQHIQQAFLNDQYQVIAATNALGMGIDKANLRFIIHFDFPGSLTAYYQEVGRAGRDGLLAAGILLYDPKDSRIQTYFIDAAQPTANDFRMVLDAIRMENSASLSQVKRLTGMHPTKLLVILAELVEQNFLTKVKIHRSIAYQLTDKSGLPNLSRYIDQLKLRYDDLQAMQDYAENKKRCLMVTLCQTLGDEQAIPCGKCSCCVDFGFPTRKNKNSQFAVASWLTCRTVSISLSKKIKNTLPGIAILDGKLRSADFIQFMRERSNSNLLQLGISDFLMDLIKNCLKEMTNYHKLSCIVAIPSRTWGGRNALVNLLGNYLKIPVLLDLLYWQEPPATRQGELLNNDQRQYNVHQRMRVLSGKKIPKGKILLVDDYIGSGATVNEAARAMREHALIENKIIPFTIAAVKWRLGKKGMI